MMLYTPMGDLMDKVGSRYMLVNAVARRAREIADEAEQQNLIIDEKTVSLAIDEIYTGKLIVNKLAVYFAYSDLTESLCAKSIF